MKAIRNIQTWNRSGLARISARPSLCTIQIQKDHYIDEPIAYEEWLTEYNRELEENERRNQELGCKTALTRSLNPRLGKCLLDFSPLNYQPENPYHTLAIKGKDNCDPSFFCQRWSRGNCALGRVQNPGECLCCKEIEKCGTAVLNEVEISPKCITLPPGFRVLYLNRWSL